MKQTTPTTSTASGNHSKPNTPMQRRFKHLFTMESEEEEIKKIQAIADKNVEDFGL